MASQTLAKILVIYQFSCVVYLILSLSQVVITLAKSSLLLNTLTVNLEDKIQQQQSSLQFQSLLIWKLVIIKYRYLFLVWNNLNKSDNSGGPLTVVIL